jgi:hypothetical protein
MLATITLAFGCLAMPQEPTDTPSPRPAQAALTADPRWKPLGKDLWFDQANSQVIIAARVCLTEGSLEHLLCASHSKEHESILATDAAPRFIHAGLILIASEPGHPVRYKPEVEPPAGPKISIELEWLNEKGELQKADARDWVRDEKTGKPLETTWVFAGSELFQDPDTKKVIYAADAGDLFTVANFPAAILDLPITSSSSDNERSFAAATPKIPPRETPVRLILRATHPTERKAKP